MYILIDSYIPFTKIILHYKKNERKFFSLYIYIHISMYIKIIKKIKIRKKNQNTEKIIEWLGGGLALWWNRKYALNIFETTKIWLIHLSLLKTLVKCVGYFGYMVILFPEERKKVWDNIKQKAISVLFFILDFFQGTGGVSSRKCYFCFVGHFGFLSRNWWSFEFMTFLNHAFFYRYDVLGQWFLLLCFVWFKWGCFAGL